MITWGFVASYSDLVTIGQPFTTTVNGNTLTLTAQYIVVTGTAGDIVWLNALGLPQYLPGAQSGQAYPIGASKIVASATVNGVVRTTAATNMCWLASPSAV